MRTRKPMLILAGLMLLMAATRFHHFGSMSLLPDASLAAFFIAGFYLPAAWVLPVLIAEAGLVDYAAISFGGTSSFCVTAAYVFLVPTYAAMWLGGRWCATRDRLGLGLERASLLVLAVLVSSSIAFLISNGSFYLFSGRIETLTWSGYVAQFAEYYPPYVAVAAAYVAVVAVVHTLFAQLGGGLGKSVARG